MAATEVTPMIPESAPVEAPETPAVETPEISTPASPEPAQAPDQAETPEQPSLAEDGRQIPPALRQHLSNLAAKPETQALAKQIKADFFTVRAYREVFPSPKEAIAAKQFFETVGGEEGLQAIEAERQEWAQVDDSFAKGDPEFINKLAKDSPESFEKLMPHALQTFQTANPEMYEHLMCRVMANTANAKNGIAAHLDKAIEAAKAANNPALSQSLAQIQSWINYFDEKASKIPEKKIDPERQKLDSDRAAFEQQKEQAFRSEVQQGVTSFTQNEVKRLLKSHLGERTISDEDLVIFYNNVVQNVAQTMQADKSYSARSERYMSAKDREGGTKYAKEKLASLLPEAVSRMYKRFYSIGAGGKVAPKPSIPAGQTSVKPAPQGWVRVQGPPSADLVDHGKTPMKMKYDSQAILRDGKKVFWGDKVPA